MSYFIAGFFVELFFYYLFLYLMYYVQVYQFVQILNESCLNAIWYIVLIFLDEWILIITEKTFFLVDMVIEMCFTWIPIFDCAIDCFRIHVGSDGMCNKMMQLIIIQKLFVVSYFSFHSNYINLEPYLQDKNYAN